MKRSEAYRILSEMAAVATSEQTEALIIAMDDIEFVEFMPDDFAPVVHGKWTLHRDGSGTCNECGMTQKNVWDDDTCQRYCGCCGARMDGE